MPGHPRQRYSNGALPPLTSTLQDVGGGFRNGEKCPSCLSVLVLIFGKLNNEETNAPRLHAYEESSAWSLRGEGGTTGWGWGLGAGVSWGQSSVPDAEAAPEAGGGEARTMS